MGLKAWTKRIKPWFLSLSKGGLDKSRFWRLMVMPKGDKTRLLGAPFLSPKGAVRLIEAFSPMLGLGTLRQAQGKPY